MEALGFFLEQYLQIQATECLRAVTFQHGVFCSVFFFFFLRVVLFTVFSVATENGLEVLGGM